MFRPEAIEAVASAGRYELLGASARLGATDRWRLSLTQGLSAMGVTGEEARASAATMMTITLRAVSRSWIYPDHLAQRFQP
jgi:hypothetical protein